MKNLIFVIGVAAIFSINACAQSENSVPEKVKTAFSQKFPNATKIKWDKESKNAWEAEFKMNGKEYSANFSTEGIWQETEYEIEESEIPDNVKNALKNEFDGYKVKEPEISENKDGKTYEFELKKGESEMEVTINNNGKVIKKENEKIENKEGD
ncbi:MAG: hypothetical protein GXO85_11105 [Chlorobi bacterium]|nr:hypothetical protein [Chlorobiota bacterium]